MGTKMPSREKDQADFDLEQFVDLFDTAMSSDNPTVRRAFKNLLLVAAVADAEESQREGLRQGPLRRLIEDQRNIIRRLETIERNQQYTTNLPGYGPVPGITTIPGHVITTTGTGTGTNLAQAQTAIGQKEMAVKNFHSLVSKLEAKSLKHES